MGKVLYFKSKKKDECKEFVDSVVNEIMNYDDEVIEKLIKELSETIHKSDFFREFLNSRTSASD